jgi:hypothetical protein
MIDFSGVLIFRRLREDDGAQDLFMALGYPHTIMIRHCTSETIYIPETLFGMWR